MFPDLLPPAPSIPRYRRPAAVWRAGSLALLVAGVLAFQHGAAVRDLDQLTVPVALQLPALEQRLSRLREQVEIADLHAALQTASVDEWIRTSVIPQSSDVSAIVDLLDALGDVMRHRGTVLTFGAVDIGEAAASADDLVLTPATVQFTATSDGAADVLVFLESAGLLTVGDVLTADERAVLMQLADGENPASVLAIEQFFATDLLTYAIDSVAIEHRVQQAFAGEVMQRAITNMSETSRLRDIRRALGGDMGHMLRNRNLWPTRFLTIRSWDEEHLAKGVVRVTVTVNAYSRP